MFSFFQVVVDYSFVFGDPYFLCCCFYVFITMSYVDEHVSKKHCCNDVSKKFTKTSINFVKGSLGFVITNDQSIDLHSFTCIDLQFFTSSHITSFSCFANVHDIDLTWSLVKAYGLYLQFLKEYV
jgi:hypothetical protein